MTLVEVIAGLALLGGVVTLLLVARGRLVSKAVESQRSAAAVKVMDGLLSEWWGSPDTFPRVGRGQREGWDWQITSVVSPSAASIDGSVVRVDLADPRGVAVSVELVLPTERSKRAPKK